MSAQRGKVLSLILLERFGPIVEKVGTYLFQYGTSPILYIKKYTDLSLSKLKEAMCVLIKYGLVSFKPNRNENIANYTLQPDKIMLMLRNPKYVSLIKRKFGEEAEIILEVLFQRGYATASDIILKAAVRLKENEKNVTLPQLKDKFISLLNAKYVIRIQKPDDENKPVPIFTVKEYELYIPPEIDLRRLSLVQNGGEQPLPDAGVYWTVNYDRFHQDMRDKIIVKAITKKFDENAGELIRIMLQQMYIRTEPWVDISNPIPILEVKDLVKKMKTHPQLIAYFDQYVNVLEMDSNKIIRKIGEASGGSFQIYLKEIFTQLTWETVEQIVLEKFDSKAARIFRLVKSKFYIEPDQLQQIAMIPAKEAKRLSYQLLEENFLELQELKKPTTNTGPTKSFTLFYIRLDNVVRMVLELSYKALFNTITRRHHDKFVNKRIIDKKQRVDTIALGMRVQGAGDEQLADIEEMITPPEKDILDKIGRTMKKLNTVELEIDDTIFLLHLYLAYQ